MKKLFYLLTGIAVICFTSCGDSAGTYTTPTEVSAVSFSETNTVLRSGAENTDSLYQYTYTIKDVCVLQDFLLTRPVEEDLAGRPYDLDDDGMWTASDLCLMRREVMYDTLSLNERDEDMKLKISVNGTELTATLADSTAAKELAEKLKTEPVTVTLNEYGGFEKVGKLPWTLTRSDESVVTKAGDIMLYQGDQMTIFYNSNSWSYTKIGTVDNITGEELEEILGEGDLNVTLSY